VFKGITTLHLTKKLLQMKKATVLLFSLLFSIVSIAQGDWKIDKNHSSIGFTTTHMLVSEVDGSFGEFEGMIKGGGEDFVNSEVTFTAQVSSITTANERRDNHLKSADFFEAEKYPEVKFAGKIVKEGDKYFLVGDFTMKAVTKPIKFDVKYNGKIDGRRGQVAGFKVQGTINRFDYGLEWNAALEAGGLVVGEEVEITCKLELNEIKA